MVFESMDEGCVAALSVALEVVKGKKRNGEQLIGLRGCQVAKFELEAIRPMA